MRILAIFACLLSVVCGYAQQQEAEAVEMCSNDVKDSIEAMKNCAEVWNQGAEPFCQFIEKFSTDEDFCNSRIKLSAAQRAEYKSILTPSNFEAKLPHVRHLSSNALEVSGCLPRYSPGNSYRDCSRFIRMLNLIEQTSITPANAAITHGLISLASAVIAAGSTKNARKTVFSMNILWAITRSALGRFSGLMRL